MRQKLKKKMSLKQEKRIAKDVGGSLVPLSGALKTSASWKGDINTKDEKYECKVTTMGAYQLHFKDLSKIRTEAIKAGKEPVFIFEFLEGPYKAKYACIFEKNNCEPSKHKSIKFPAKFLYMQTLNSLVYFFKYVDKKIERGVSVYKYEDYIKYRDK